ncbi:MAG: isoprenylcysteine carboxylmethyltransferase family protein [Candidatus Omnitrophota bacterium]|nr:isoprenylcysteine carboxylmethyltransferase family protein [Candidatus Omnitrophota bacterium]MDZ4243004.1 isoprenylcysteine carboxylmethyltransferase family protein [Candidatus Omnitrophota bacterium]
MSDHPDVMTRPPNIYFGFLILGMVLQILFPWSFLPAAVQWFAGSFVFGLGLALMSAGIRQMKNAGTGLKTHEPAETVLTEGLYRFSRNPLYVATTLMYSGIGLMFDNAWILMLIVPLLAVMHYGVVLREEEYLEKKFGDRYLRYKSSVRRWL